MLTRFFTNNEDTISPMNIGTEWILKGHAKENFFKWVSGWSISMRKPSDLGYSDALHVLPELIEKETIIRNVNPLAINGQGSLFTLPAQNFFEIKAEVRSTIHERCEKAVEKCLQHDISMLWVNLNDEGDLIESLLPNSIQISGQDTIEAKEEAVKWFVGDVCICNSPNFGTKLAKKCGNLNTQKQEEKNTKPILQKEKDENFREELQKKIKNTWQSITKLIQKSSKTKMPMKGIEKDGRIIEKIQNIEKSVNSYQINTIKKIHISELNAELIPMALALKNITLFLKGSNTNAEFAMENLTQVEKNLWLLTIVIKQIKSEEYCVYHAISELDTSKKISNHCETQSCTCGHISGVRRLISKTKIFGFGLNLQHCNHTTYFPTYSYEQYYQALRRFWRFGQKRKVFADLILSDGQTRIMQSLMVKKDKAITMFENLTKLTNSDFKIERKEFNKKIKLPSFI